MIRKIAFFLGIFTLISILPFIIDPKTTGEVQIGWPYCYYWSFQVNGNEFRNFGWDIKHLVYSTLISFFVAFVMYPKVRKKEKKE